MSTATTAAGSASSSAIEPVYQLTTYRLAAGGAVELRLAGGVVELRLARGA